MNNWPCPKCCGFHNSGEPCWQPSTTSRNEIANNEPRNEWITTNEAAQLLFCVPSVLSATGNETVRKVIDRKLRSAHGLRGHGIVWRRSDVEKLVAIRRECKLGIAQASRVLDAQKAGRI